MTTPALKSATCKFCDQEMNGNPCLSTTYEIEGVEYARIPMAAFDWAPEIRACNDCGVAVGDLHHPGCDLEECPRCHDQLLASPCYWELTVLTPV